MNIAVPINPVTLTEARKKCDINNYDIHLVKESDLQEFQVYPRKDNSMRPIHDLEVISESTPIIDVPEELSEKEQLSYTQTS